MSRKRSEAKDTDPKQDYWIRFLQATNIYNPFITLGEEKLGEEEVPIDPIFQEFLMVASKYGAPKTVQEFLNLSANDKAYYLKAYQIYKREMNKKKKI